MSNSEKYNQTLEFLKGLHSDEIEAGIVLGTGLGGLVAEMNVQVEIPYRDIPHFPISTVESHEGTLVFGTIGNKKVVAMKGRFHFYEGYTMQEITYPIRIMKLLGAKSVFLSNASGSLNLQYKKADVVLIHDHINLQTSNPLIGKNDHGMGPRFPDMSRPYDADYIHKAWKIAKHENIRIHKGVYVAVNGPNLETRAEYKFLRIIGADIVGMSTVPEVIVARQMNMRVFALSLVTDECDPTDLKEVEFADILRVAKEAEPSLTKILTELIVSED
ncbi:MAG TPA: purine-nucleoside phosphorylase [Cytophagaceae bacterium]|jgi:purine-nucleoside phosphorylase